MNPSRIEQAIDEIYNYVEECKPSKLYPSKVVVDREQLYDLLDELRLCAPEEIKRYQKIINNKEAILADAQAKADQIIAQAQIQTSELVSEHQIMQQAYAQANEVVMLATKQAQDILDEATNEANNIRMGAMTYTDSQLRTMEDILTTAIDTTTARTNNLVQALNESLKVISANRAELFPAVVEAAEEVPAVEKEKSEQVKEAVSDDVDVSKINISIEPEE